MAKGKYQYWLTDEGLALIEGWARDGLTDKEIANKMGITSTTFYRWQNDFREFCESLKKGKEVVDYEVEKALIKAACGYVTTEVIEELVDGKMTPVKRIKKFVPPNVTALIFWLKNRRPDKWRDRQLDTGNAEALEKLDNILSEIKSDVDGK